MKISVKRLVSIAAAVVITSAFGLAYAADDQMPDLNAPSRDTGIVLHESFLKDEAAIGTGTAAGGVRMEGAGRQDVYGGDEIPVLGKGRKDLGIELSDTFLKHEADVSKGSAPGGVRERVMRWPDDAYPYGIAK